MSMVWSGLGPGSEPADVVNRRFPAVARAVEVRLNQT
jgi:hypothetical protein